MTHISPAEVSSCSKVQIKKKFQDGDLKKNVKCVQPISMTFGTTMHISPQSMIQSIDQHKFVKLAPYVTEE